MSDLHVSVTGQVGASPAAVYALLRDYRDGHPTILPKPWFSGLTVLEGGLGAGTVVRTEMAVMGRSSVFTLTISEPEPGRVLAEEDAAAGTATTFTVEPLDGGARSRVTIASDMRMPGGIAGWLQKQMAGVLTRRIYRAELAQLDAVMRQRAGGL